MQIQKMTNLDVGIPAHYISVAVILWRGPGGAYTLKRHETKLEPRLVPNQLNGESIISHLKQKGEI